MREIPRIEGLVGYLRDPLRKNSAFLIGSHLLIGLLGFFFWAMAARLYEPEEVGLATALVSAVLLLHTFSRLGLEFSLVRFLPSEEDKAAMMNTCFTLAGVFSAVLAAVFLGGVIWWSPALSFIRDDARYILAFIGFTVAVSLVALLRQGVYVAYRRTELSFGMEMIAGLRLPLLVVFVGAGTLGSFSAWGLASLVAMVAGIAFIGLVEKGYRPVPGVRRGLLRRIMGFSLGNYVAEGFRELPGFLLPLLVVNILDAETAAYFYVAWTIATVILMISHGTGFSLLAESSVDPGSFQKDLMRAMKFMFLLLVPAIILVFVFGRTVLGFFGEAYADNGYRLLCLLALSGIPLTFNVLYITWKRLLRETRPILLIYAFVAVATIGMGYALMEERGLEGIGIAWLISNGLVAVLVVGAGLGRLGWGQKRDAQDGKLTL